MTTRYFKARNLRARFQQLKCAAKPDRPDNALLAPLRTICRNQSPRKRGKLKKTSACRSHTTMHALGEGDPLTRRGAMPTNPAGEPELRSRLPSPTGAQ